MERPRRTWHGHHTERDSARARPKARHGSFAAQVVVASLLFAIVVWNAVPVASPLRTADEAEIVTPIGDSGEVAEMPAQPHGGKPRPEQAGAALLDATQPKFAAVPPRNTERPERAERAEGSVFYRNCTAARASGAAPIYRGEPGYRPEMDGDSDGIACEPYR